MRKILILFPLIFITLFLTGGFSADANFKSIKNITLNELGKEFETDAEFSLGGFEIWILDGLAGFIEDDEIATTFLSSVSGIQIGVYKRNSNGNLFPQKNLLTKIDKQMNRKGWKYVVKSFESNEMSAVYINKDSEIMLKELFVVNVDNSEVTIVHISGDLEKIIEAAIKEHGIRWNKKEEEREIANR